IRDEMDDKRRSDDVEFTIAERKAHRVCDLKVDARERLSGVIDLRRRWVDGGYRFRRAAAQDQVTERAGAAADVEPSRVVRRLEPGEELRADRATPPPHESLVVVGGIESDLDLGHARFPLSRRGMYERFIGPRQGTRIPSRAAAVISSRRRTPRFTDPCVA